MDSNEIEQAKTVLAKVLAAVEAGELEASPVELGALVGALEALTTIRETTV